MVSVYFTHVCGRAAMKNFEHNKLRIRKQIFKKDIKLYDIKSALQKWVPNKVISLS